jgi:hypothetical protein
MVVGERWLVCGDGWGGGVCLVVGWLFVLVRPVKIPHKFSGLLFACRVSPTRFPSLLPACSPALLYTGVVSLDECLRSSLCPRALVGN